MTEAARGGRRGTRRATRCPASTRPGSSRPVTPIGCWRRPGDRVGPLGSVPRAAPRAPARRRADGPPLDRGPCARGLRPQDSIRDVLPERYGAVPRRDRPAHPRDRPGAFVIARSRRSCRDRALQPGLAGVERLEQERGGDRRVVDERERSPRAGPRDVGEAPLLLVGAQARRRWPPLGRSGSGRAPCPSR